MQKEEIISDIVNILTSYDWTIDSPDITSLLKLLSNETLSRIFTELDLLNWNKEVSNEKI